MHPEVGAGGELNFWNARGAAWHRSGAAGNEKPFLAKAAADYLGVLRAIAPRAARVTDKMPFNFLWAGLIHVAFPRAIIIHCRRAAIDTALSIHQTHFHPALAFPTGGAELVAYFRSYQRLIDHWRSVLPADRFIEVDYEDLTRAPEPVIRRIIAACGLAWHDACLRPECNPRAVKTPSKWQTRQPIYRTSVARWRRYEPWLGPLRALVDDGRNWTRVPPDRDWAEAAHLTERHKDQSTKQTLLNVERRASQSARKSSAPVMEVSPDHHKAVAGRW